MATESLYKLKEYCSDSSEHESSVKYDEFGRLNNYTLKRGNGSSAFSKSYQYETTNGSQTNRISTVTDGSDTYQYSYSNGNLTTVKKNGTIQSSYLLDANNGRLVYESQPLMGINQQYDYDKDNITRVYSNSALKTYETYGYTDNLLTSYTKENITRYFAYDGMGNPVRYKTASQTSDPNMVWTEGRGLKSGIQNGKAFSYEYDALGKRYQKTVDGKVTKQYWSGNDLVAEERINGTSTTVLIFLYDWTGVCGMKRLSEKSDGSVQTDTYWFKKNELGDIAEIYGVNGKICEYRCDAWGNYRLIDSGTGMDVTKDQVIGGISTNVSMHIGHINPFRYRGYYYDEETGFYYLNTRYYDPEIRRFINADNPELVAQLAQTPGQLNLYAYCNNNPVAFTDESGESVWAIIVVGLIVTVISGISGGYSAAACNQNFWIGFAAGAAAGLVGYALGLLKMPYLGRMVSSAGYTLLNSWWQNGEITQDDWLFIAGDLFMDIPLSFLGKYYIGSLKESMQNIILTALDGATDYIQTRGLVELLPERYLKADSSQTQSTRNFSMQNSDAQKFYIVGI